jgi:phospholipid/cholesterol/gamma-HCH transport system substrate-binding protein
MAMQEPPDNTITSSEPVPPRPVRNLELKAAALLVFTALLIAGSVLYLLYARGVFQPTSTLVLTTDDSEGVVVGMDITFSGFPIGRVRKVELAETGNVRIVIDVPKKDAHWLRTSSVFTLVRGLVGGTAIRAYSGVLADPPLPDGAERAALRGDATAELPRVLSTAKEVLENVSAMTSQDAALRQSIANLQEVTARLKGPRGALGVMFGNDADAAKLVAALERTNALLARMDTLAAKADTQVFGPDGVMKEARATVGQLNALLAETRESLKKVDAVLVEAQGISANVRGASSDLGTLRNDVEANLRKVEGLINELNRKWPFARDTEVKLP